MKKIENAVLKALPILFTLALLIILSKPVYGQTERVIYETFEVGDSVELIELDIAGERSFESWPADRVMIETTILLEGAPPRILDFFVEQGRYSTLTQGGTKLTLTSKDKVRRPLKYKDNDCFELVKVKIFVPAGMVAGTDGRTIEHKSGK